MLVRSAALSLRHPSAGVTSEVCDLLGWRPSFDALCAATVAEREYGWTEAGKSSAARNGVAESEVVDAV
jgi:hypothetical protein